MSNTRERLVSVLGGRACHYVDLKTPSKLIPFKGNFPLLEPYRMREYYEAIQNTNYISELSEEFQEVTMKGNKIALMEEGFIDYLRSLNISRQEFLQLSNSEKSTKLIEWMNKDCLDFSQLTIK